MMVVLDSLSTQAVDIPPHVTTGNHELLIPLNI